MQASREWTQFDGLRILNVHRIGFVPFLGHFAILDRVDEYVERTNAVEQWQICDGTWYLTHNRANFLLNAFQFFARFRIIWIDVLAVRMRLALHFKVPAFEYLFGVSVRYDQTHFIQFVAWQPFCMWRWWKQCVKRKTMCEINASMLTLSLFQNIFQKFLNLHIGRHQYGETVLLMILKVFSWVNTALE